MAKVDVSLRAAQEEPTALPLGHLGSLISTGARGWQRHVLSALVVLL